MRLMQRQRIYRKPNAPHQVSLEGKNTESADTVVESASSRTTGLSFLWFFVHKRTMTNGERQGATRRFHF